jgi:hypothetical protein
MVTDPFRNQFLALISPQKCINLYIGFLHSQCFVCDKVEIVLYILTALQKYAYIQKNGARFRHVCGALMCALSSVGSQIQRFIFRYGHLLISAYNWMPEYGKLWKETPWPEFASELYPLRDLRLSAKLVPTFAVPRGQRDGSLHPYSRFSRSESLLSCTHEAEWTPFQTHYFSENLVAPGRTGPLDL